MRQAATKLRVTPITIRRRLRRGELEGRLADTPSGQAWLVRLPDQTPCNASRVRESAAEDEARVRARHSVENTSGKLFGFCMQPD